MLGLCCCAGFALAVGSRGHSVVAVCGLLVAVASLASFKLNIQKTKIMVSSPITSCQIDGKQWKQWQTLFEGASKSLQMVTAAMKILTPWKKSYDQPRQRIKKQRHYFANKDLSSQSYAFSSSHV